MFAPPRPHLTVLGPGEPAASPGTDLTDLAERIRRGELDAELRRLAPVLTRRLRLLSVAETLLRLASFRAGDRVLINHHLRPLYLQGLAGTVMGTRGEQVLVRLDRPVGRFADGELRCSPGALEKLDDR